MIKAVIDTNVIVSAYITKNLDAATSYQMGIRQNRYQWG